LISNLPCEMSDRAERTAQQFRVPITIAALFVIPVLILQGVTVHGRHLSAPWGTVASVGNWAIWLTFLAEVVAMLAVVPDRLAWLRAHWLDVAIVIVTPPVSATILQAVRVLRLLRLVRLARFAPLMRSVFTIEGVRYAALLAFVVFVAGAEAFSSLENKSIGLSMYWAISTMTTVGYGDVTPTTAGGRIVAAVVMLVGVGFVAVVTGAIAQRFIAVETPRDGSVQPDTDADAITHAKLDALASRIEQLEAMIAERRA
jgi:voltage-gated potassium channel